MNNLGIWSVTAELRCRITVASASAFAAALIFSMPTAQGQDATWLPAPFNDDFNNTNNWNPATVPTGTAFFNTSNQTNLRFFSNTTIGGWTFNSGADNYNFIIDAGRVLQFIGAGIEINGGGATITNNGDLAFEQGSTAGDAVIINNNAMGFTNSSTAGNATITNNKNLDFFNQSTAGNSTIINNAAPGSGLQFFQRSTAGNANIINNSFIGFRNQSTAGNADITNNDSLRFIENSIAGAATIKNNSELIFF